VVWVQSYGFLYLLSKVNGCNDADRTEAGGG
jgi:hypothetical protein